MTNGYKFCDFDAAEGYGERCTQHKYSGREVIFAQLPRTVGIREKKSARGGDSYLKCIYRAVKNRKAGICKKNQIYARCRNDNRHWCKCALL